MQSQSEQQSNMPQEQCPEREETRYDNVEEFTFELDDLPPQLENELEYAWGEDDSGNGDDIDNEAPLREHSATST